MRESIVRAAFAVGVLATVLGSDRAASADEKTARLEATVKALSDSASDCLLSVRDKGTKYDKTPACTALDHLSMKYIEAGGGQSSTPMKYELQFTQAQRSAWIALATSESCTGRPMKIW